ncbi:MAG: helix-hairpin-helix domain-containing protein [Clostridiales Family XIII bacterium]|jgi:competence protein ComEA|nr:helix-hairpin-helix domain-containing protein [Clostridiales Family XIII bacterium]
MRKIKKLLIWIAIASVAATVYLITANLGGPIKVDVAGEVANPDVYELERGSRVQEAIEMAGGLTENADAGYLNRAAVLHDGDKLYVPTKEAEPEKTPQDTEDSLSDTDGQQQDYSTEEQPASTESTGITPSDSITDPININTADAETLQTIKDIGPVTAKKIIDYRTKNGPFKKKEDIKKVEDIGEKTYENLKAHIRVR